MRYLPHTPADIDAMLNVVGVQNLNDLFAVIPDACRRKTPLTLHDPMSEWRLDRHMEDLAGMSAVPPSYVSFLGAGSYDHYIPEVIRQLLNRGEFSTAYTPYQPEVSQGTLQAIYEYQTLVTRLLGMDVANASMYDGASALAEALLMAIRITGRSRVIISKAVNPFYRQVVKTYLRPTGFDLVESDYGADGRTNPEAMDNAGDVAAVAVQSPNFFGCIEDLADLEAHIHADPKTLFIVAFSEPLAYGIYQKPGALGADIVCGEGQSLGIPQSFGGPGIGIFTTRRQYMRHMPGRLVGRTVDTNDRRGFVLTLATREQHIRREKATSNICSNQGLCAMAAAMYMATLGGSGFRRLARLNFDKAQYLKNQIRKAGPDIGMETVFNAPTFNEFVVRTIKEDDDFHTPLLDKKIIAGLPLEPYYPELPGHYLMCVTETCDKTEMDIFIKEVGA
jgi:glycine dehydrogenase subunit 1